MVGTAVVAMTMTIPDLSAAPVTSQPRDPGPAQALPKAGTASTPSFVPAGLVSVRRSANRRKTVDHAGGERLASAFVSPASTPAVSGRPAPVTRVKIGKRLPIHAIDEGVRDLQFGIESLPPLAQSAIKPVSLDLDRLGGSETAGQFADIELPAVKVGAELAIDEFVEPSEGPAPYAPAYMAPDTPRAQTRPGDAVSARAPLVAKPDVPIPSRPSVVELAELLVPRSDVQESGDGGKPVTTGRLTPIEGPGDPLSVPSNPVPDEASKVAIEVPQPAPSIGSAPGTRASDALDIVSKSRLAARVNGVRTGSVDFQQLEGTIAIKLRSVLDLLHDRYNEDEYQALRGAQAIDTYVPLAQLQGAGIPIDYNPVYDEIEFDIDYQDAPEAAKVQVEQIGAPTVGTDRALIDQIRF